MSFYPPILLEAVKEQQRMIEEQKNSIESQNVTIEALTKSNAAFNQRITQLEKMVGKISTQSSTASLLIGE